jgi:NAD(P)-dependent dehydrogenase (short-subunit alcohol dehydrogenase family)
MPVTLDLSGRAAIVTGASSGIGVAVARALGEAGADVVVVGRDVDRLRRSAGGVREAGARVRELQADITTDGAPEQIVGAALDAFGRVDVLVHSAALFEPVPIAETSPDSLDRQWETNVRAPFLLTQAALPHLGAGSSVIFISSIAGHVGFPSSAAYCATKGAVESLVRALSLELSPLGIRANVIAPGNIRTPMNEDLRALPGYEERLSGETPAGRFGEPEEIAAAVVFFASDAASYVHGASLLVDGGWIAR